jgi:hypothetical protein
MLDHRMSPVDRRPDCPGRSATSDLARRYAHWTALFYPAAYRGERGSELVDTYLALPRYGSCAGW